MITTERYFIHVDNKSVVPWTSEIAENYKFKEIRGCGADHAAGQARHA